MGRCEHLFCLRVPNCFRIGWSCGVSRRYTTQGLATKSSEDLPEEKRSSLGNEITRGVENRWVTTSSFGKFGRHEETPVGQASPEMRDAHDFTFTLREQVPGTHKICSAIRSSPRQLSPIGKYYQTESSLTKAGIEIAPDVINGRSLTAYSIFEHEGSLTLARTSWISNPSGIEKTSAGAIVGGVCGLFLSFRVRPDLAEWCIDRYFRSEDHGRAHGGKVSSFAGWVVHSDNLRGADFLSLLCVCVEHPFCPRNSC